MATTRAVISDEDLFRLPKDGSKYEVVDGELLQMSPAGWFHERVVMALGIELGAFVHEYLDAGVRLMWVIDPKARTAAAYRSLTQVRQIQEDGDLEGEEVVPGFSCHLARVFGKR